MSTRLSVWPSDWANYVEYILSVLRGHVRVEEVVRANSS